MRAEKYERRSAVRFDWLLNPQWTDLAVVVGPNVAWVQADVEDILTYRPEILLGYRVKMMVPASMSLRGFHVMKLVVLYTPDYSVRERRDLHVMASLTRAYGGKVESWFVHRTHGIERVY